jgi:hypothetical protein
VQSGRRGKITWGTIDSDPESIIDPKFLLELNLRNPTRMSLKDVTAYWKHWVSSEKEGDPFSFSSLEDDSDRDKVDEGNDRGRVGEGSNRDEGNGDSDRDQGNDASDGVYGSNGTDENPAENSPIPPPDHLSIDDGALCPLQCKTPSARTKCLQKLVSEGSQTNRRFHRVVKMVDTFEVSSISDILFPSYLIQF